MACIEKMSENEKTELYSQISEMAREGTRAPEIAGLLDLRIGEVREICADLEIPLAEKPPARRTLTKAELKIYRKERIKNVPIVQLAKRFGVSRMFLFGLDRYIKPKVECRDCHTPVASKKIRYCPACGRRRDSISAISYEHRRYHSDPVYRAKRIAYVKNYIRNKKNQLTSPAVPG
jgi:rubrerythrin